MLSAGSGRFLTPVVPQRHLHTRTFPELAWRACCLYPPPFWVLCLKVFPVCAVSTTSTRNACAACSLTGGQAPLRPAVCYQWSVGCYPETGELSERVKSRAPERCFPTKSSLVWISYDNDYEGTEINTSLANCPSFSRNGAVVIRGDFSANQLAIYCWIHTASVSGTHSSTQAYSTRKICSITKQVQHLKVDLHDKCPRNSKSALKCFFPISPASSYGCLPNKRPQAGKTSLLTMYLRLLLPLTPDFFLLISYMDFKFSPLARKCIPYGRFVFTWVSNLP